MFWRTVIFSDTNIYVTQTIRESICIQFTENFFTQNFLMHCFWKFYIYNIHSESESCSVMSNSLQLHGLQLVWLCWPWRFSRQEYSNGLPCPPSGYLPNPGIKPRPLALQVDSLLSEPPGKPKNTGVGSLSLFQGIFSTQESNWSLLHCRLILYQLSYQGSPLQRILPTKWKHNPYSQWEFAVWLRELKQGLCNNLDGWHGEGDSREVWEGQDMGVSLADSCWSLTENNKIL